MTYLTDLSKALGHTLDLETMGNAELDKEHLVHLPQTLANRYNKKIILVLDDFDIISGPNTRIEFPKLLVTTWLQQKSVSMCVFTKTCNDSLSERILFKTVIFTTLGKR